MKKNKLLTAIMAGLITISATSVAASATDSVSYGNYTMNAPNIDGESVYMYEKDIQYKNYKYTFKPSNENIKVSLWRGNNLFGWGNQHMDVDQRIPNDINKVWWYNSVKDNYHLHNDTTADSIFITGTLENFNAK